VGQIQQEIRQLREGLLHDIQGLLAQQTQTIQNIVKESAAPTATLSAKHKATPNVAKETRFQAAPEHPMAVPAEGGRQSPADLGDEDTEMLTDVVPSGAVTPPPSNPKKEGWKEPKGGSGGGGGGEAGGGRGRKTILQRVGSYLADDDEDKHKQRKKANLYSAPEQDLDVKLDEEVYDVANFYKKHGFCQGLARNDKFERFTLFVICVNAIYIGVDADNNDAATLLNAEWPYVVCDNFFCLFFTLELAIRFGAFEMKRNCLRDMWFVFDSVLVMLMVFETWLLTVGLMIAGSADGSGLPTGPLRLLRLLRLSRLVRLLRSLPELLTLVNGMRAASRAVTSALMLIIGLNYVFAIVINMFLRDVTTESQNIEAKFSTLGLSMWSLALHGTFADAISDIMEDMRAIENEPEGDWPLGWSMITIFFFYVLLTNITVMNMLIGIVCEVVSEVKLGDEKNTAIDYLKRNLRQLLMELDEDDNNQISKSELHAASQIPRAREVLKELDVNVDNLIVLTEPLFEQDADAGREQEVTREELLNVILEMRGDRDVRMEDIVELRCDIRRFVHRQTNEMLKKTDEIAGHVAAVADFTRQMTDESAKLRG